MDELSTQLEELTTNLDDTNSSLSDTQDTVSTHDDTLGDHETRLTDTEAKAGQLDFPLTQDSIARIKEVFPSGQVTLSGGTASVSNQNVNSISVILLSVLVRGGVTGIAVGDPHLVYYTTIVSGGFTVNSTISTDVSKIGYVIF